MSLSDFDRVRLSFRVGSQASSVDGNIASKHGHRKLEIKEAWLNPDAAYTASGTNFATVTIKNGTTTHLSFTTKTTASGGTGDVTAYTPLDLTSFISTSTIAADAALVLASAKSANGKKWEGEIELICEPVTP